MLLGLFFSPNVFYAQMNYQVFYGNGLIDGENITLLPDNPENDYDALTYAFYYNESANLQFIPVTADKPVTLRVNLVFIQNLNGQGNFTGQEDDFDEIFTIVGNGVNNHYKNLVNPNDPACYSGTDFVPDTKIRFVFNYIFVKVPDQYFDYPGGLAYGGSAAIQNLNYVFDNYVKTSPNYKDGICYFLTTNKSNWEAMVVNQTTTTFAGGNLPCAMFPSPLNTDYNNFANLPDAFCKYWWMRYILSDSPEYPYPWEPVIKSWYIDGMIQTLTHELGHSLSLGHTCPYYGLNTCFYSIMNQASSSPHNYLPPSEIGKMHKAIRISNVRRYVTEESFNPDPLVITANTVWNFNQKLYRNVTVAPGAKLSVGCRTVFDHRANILVSEGGKLEINGGELTTDEEVLWKGIIVDGNPDFNQAPSMQGVVSVTNNGTIANAEIGVRCYLLRGPSPDGPGTGEINLFDKTDGGGMVQAIQGRFVNNRIAVAFANYNHISQSYFKNTEFIVDNELISGINANYFVTLQKMSNVRFEGCSFKDLRAVNVLSDRYSGIYSFGSGYTLQEYCLESNPYTGECLNSKMFEMSGLNYGVRALGNGSVSVAYVKNGQFSDVGRGIYVSAQKALVLSNSFTNSVYGLYLEGSTGYHVEGNQFINTLPGQTGVGIYVSNSGNDHNELYNNTFNKLSYGIATNGDNRGASYDGLCISCNDFMQTKYDIAVSPVEGVAQNQLNVGVGPAANTFSAISNGHYDIINNGLPIVYKYPIGPSGVRLRPELSCVFGPVTVTNDPQSGYYTKDAFCPSKISNGGQNINTTLATMDVTKQTAENLKAELDGKIDGGETNNLQNKVETSTVYDAYDVTQNLAEKGQYLSDEVLVSTASKEGSLDDAMIRDILVQNPQAAKSEAVLGALDNRANPLPEYMIDQILSGADILGAKEMDELQLADYFGKYGEEWQKIEKYYIDNNDFSSLIWFYTNKPTLQGFQKLVLHHLDQDQPEQAAYVMSLIPAYFQLNEAEQSDYSDLDLYIGMISQAKQEMVTDSSLSVQTIDNLVALTSKTNLAANLARNFLVDNGIISYEEQMVLAEPVGFKKVRIRNSNSDSYQPYTLLPNPASDYVIIEYHSGCQGTEFEIVDSKGQIVISKIFSESENRLVIPLKGLSAGTYITRLKSGSGVVGTSKLVIR